MSRAKCVICEKPLKEEGKQICTDCMVEKSGEETAEELRDIEDVLSIAEEKSKNIKKSMEAIMRIAYRIERKEK
ncbi:MAG: hypothetical protein HFI82_13335 [Eubacterium sp.]|nr:hypothetical protein [Eubacterium sp.]